MSARGSAPLRTPSLAMEVTGYDQATYDPEKAGITTLALGPDGTHGTGYRFMPSDTMPKGSSPVILTIAGLYPGLSADDLLRPQPLPFAPKGQFNYHMLTGQASSSGFVALPGSELLDTHPNTVAVVCSSSSLGLSFADGQDREVLALIDRSDAATVEMDAFDNRAFYAFGDEHGQVHIRWMEALPDGWRVLGRMLYAQMPCVKTSEGSDGFAECSDEFEF